MTQNPVESADQLELEIPPEVEYLVVLRRFMATIAHQVRMTSLEGERLVMAVGEAGAQAVARVSRLKKSQRPGAIRIEVKLSPRRLTILIEDCGEKVSWKTAPSTTSAEIPGAQSSDQSGIQLAGLFMDEVYGDYLPGRGNRVTMIKYLHQDWV